MATELSAEEAVRRDEELTVEVDNSSKTGLRQRSARPDANSNSPTGVTADAESEIEKAKARNVLVEKIVWGHGLSAKNEEYQRQLKEKEAVQEERVADVHAVAKQFNTVPAQSPVQVQTHTRTSSANNANTATAATTTTTTSTATFAAPPVPPRPAAMNETIAITDSATKSTYTPVPYVTSGASGITTASITASNSSAASTSTTVLDSRTVTNKSILLDTRSIPNVVETYAADNHKEL